MNKLSIITINFNNCNGLKRTLDSVTGQSYSDFEYIVIDGGSSDGSRELIEKYADNITYWVSEPDRGIYHAMNKGIKKANGEYLLFMNSGDLFYNTEVLKDNIHAIIDFDLIYFNLYVKGDRFEFVKNYEEEITINFLFSDSMPHQSTFIKKSLFREIGFYDENLRIVSDWKFFLLALIKHKCSYKRINKTLSIYYLGGISSKVENKALNDSERELFLKHEFPMIKKLYDDYLLINKDFETLDNKVNEFKSSKKYKILRFFRMFSKFS